MLILELTTENLTDEIIDRVLFDGIEDTGEDVDCVIVLGSTKASIYRVPVAAKAYHAKRTSKLLLSGGIVNGCDKGHAEDMRKKAIARYLFPDHIHIIPGPADDNNTKRDNWMLSEEGRKRAQSEVVKIINCVNNWLFPDFEI